jgi:hypothetical protein
MIYQEDLMNCLLTINRVRAAKAGSAITAAFLARDMGRFDGREFVEARATRKPGEPLRMSPNPYREPNLRRQWDLGFWEVVAEMREE